MSKHFGPVTPGKPGPQRQHTPRPWKVNAIAKGRIVGDETAASFDKLQINGANCTIATVYRREDARLIAAAPDLLAALRKIEHQAIAGEGTLDENGTAVGAEDFAFIVDTARAAIAKAEWIAANWTEYDGAADWCAARNITGKIGDQLPDGLSAPTLREINDDTEAFQRRVRECAYARAMNKAKGGGA